MAGSRWNSPGELFKEIAGKAKVAMEEDMSSQSADAADLHFDMQLARFNVFDPLCNPLLESQEAMWALAERNLELRAPEEARDAACYAKCFSMFTELALETLSKKWPVQNSTGI
jgi:hypothetical protein